MSVLQFLMLGTSLMFVIMFLCLRKKYSIIKIILLTIVLTICGVFSTKLMRYIEAGVLSGFSFFGAVLFIPILLFVFSFILRVKFFDYLDAAAPAVCIMHAVMKVDCYLTGCCSGMVLYAEGETIIRFPSRFVEGFTSIIIMAYLLKLILKDQKEKCIYPTYMVLYGITRFVYNFFRSDMGGKILFLHVGNFWSIVSIIVGLLSLKYLKKKYEVIES